MPIEVAIIALFIGLGSGYGISKIQFKQAGPSPAVDVAEASPTSHDRLRMMNRWRDALSRFYCDLTDAITVENMAANFATSLSRELVDVHLIIAIGPVKDILLLNTLAADHKATVLMTDPSCIVSEPAIDQDLARELAQELYEVAKKIRTTSRKRWRILREVDSTLHARLVSRFGFHGAGLLIPLLYDESLCGVMLVAEKQFDKQTDIQNDSGQFAVMAADAMISWVHAIAPQLLAGTAANPLPVTPTHAIASLNVIEQAVASIQETEETQEVFAELARFTHAANIPTAEISLLASQSCQTLRRICHADFAMFLRHVDTDGVFAAEAIETDQWSWSRYQGLKGSDTPFPFTTKILNAWPDAFVRHVRESGALFQTKNSEDTNRWVDTLTPLELATTLIIPTQIRGACVAILVIGRRQSGGITEQATIVASSVAATCALSLASMFLLQQTITLQGEVQKGWSLASTLAKQSLETLITIVQKRSIFTFTDAYAVAKYAEAMAMYLRLSSTEISNIRLASLLCDIGKIMIPTSVLRKEGGLTGEEWQLIQSHPVVSTEILHNYMMVKGALPLIYHHHEHYDGSGYPEQLRGDKIPIGSQIIAVADTFVSLQSKRPYRDALSRAEAINTIHQQAGKELNPDVVKVFLAIMNNEDRLLTAA